MPYGTVNADVIGTSVAGSNLGAGNASIMKNRIINGAMVIDQRNAGASVAITTSDTYVTDRFCPQIFGGATGRFTGQQVTTAPTGFNNSLQLTVTTTAASPSSADGYCIQQRIEGYNTADLGFGTADAKTITVSFWVRSSVTGSFGLLLNNSLLTRAYGVLYTISAANTWEQKTITIAGDTTGTWGVTNGTGICVSFALGGGSGRTVSTGWNVYGSGAAPAYVTGGVNLMATSGATFYITGVQLEVGSSATGFEYRQYQQELALCQRYFLKYSNSAFGTYCNGFGESGGGNVTYQITYPVQMRTGATIALSGTNRILPAAGSLSNNTIAYSQLGVYGGYFGVNTSSVTYGFSYLLGPSNDTTAFLSFSAEL